LELKQATVAADEAAVTGLEVSSPKPFFSDFSLSKDDGCVIAIGVSRFMLPSVGTFPWPIWCCFQLQL
jgi:hypothetical protein